MVLDGVGVGRPARRRGLRRRRVGHTGQPEPRGRTCACRFCRAWGSGTSSPSWACRRCRRPLALVGPPGDALGRQGHHRRPLGAHGLGDGPALPHLSRRVPRGGAGSVPRAHRAGRAGQQDGVRHGDHRRAGRGAHGHRKADRLHLGGQRLPDRRPRGGRAPGAAVRVVRDRPRDPAGTARRGAGHRPALHRAVRGRSRGPRTGATSRWRRPARRTSTCSTRPGCRCWRWGRSARCSSAGASPG